MENAKIIDTNPSNIHQFGMCAYKDMKQPGYKNKVEWTKNRFKEGLRYKVLFTEEDGAVGNIEYIPGENAWRPVNAKDYLFIHCILILHKKYKHKGYGQMLLDSCIDDARENDFNGVAVTVRKTGWMADRDLFIKNGFKVADTVKPDFELLVLKIKSDTPDPSFQPGLDKILENYKNGFYLISSDQCPYTFKAIQDISNVAKSDYGLESKVIELIDHKAAQNAPTLYGTFTIIYNGEILTDHVISATRFKNIMKKK